MNTKKKRCRRWTNHEERRVVCGRERGHCGDCRFHLRGGKILVRMDRSVLLRFLRCSLCG